MNTPTIEYVISGYTYLSSGYESWVWLDSAETFEESLELLEYEKCKNSGEYTSFCIEHVVTTVVG